MAGRRDPVHVRPFGAHRKYPLKRRTAPGRFPAAGTRFPSEARLSVPDIGFAENRLRRPAGKLPEGISFADNLLAPWACQQSQASVPDPSFAFRRLSVGSGTDKLA